MKSASTSRSSGDERSGVAPSARTANALRVRQGRPIEPHSRCSDGGWTFDGTTLGFSHDIVTAPPDIPMPLTMKLDAAS